MCVSRDAVKDSYRYCRRVSRQAGSNFHRAFRLLPHDKRNAMYALYAFMRQTDDLADDSHFDVDSTQRREALNAWRSMIYGEHALNAAHIHHSSFIIHHCSPILPALEDAIRRYDIPREHLIAVIDGVMMDLQPQRYETFDQLQQYCERVASAVGLACIHIWGFKGPAAFEPARQTGIALQLTNILRDLKEDARQNRIYLPQEDLRRCGYSEQNLCSGVVNEQFLRLMRLEIDRAKKFYASGAKLMDLLHPDGKRVFGLMTATYQAVLRRIARRPADVFCYRVQPGIHERLRLLLRWWLLP